MITLITTAQCALLLNRSQGHIKRLCREGELGARKVGRDWLMPVPDPDAINKIKIQRIERGE